MIDTLLLHPRTRLQLEQYIAAPCHAELLVAPHGMGKTHIAQAMAAAVLDINQPLAEYPYYTLITPDNNSISIDAIRELQHFLQLKTVGHDKALRRVVIIEHAESLTVEAQNAFLKILEEPPADTLLILTASSQRALLPTILSRVQTITISLPTEADTKTYFASAAAETAITQAYFLSSGLPGLMKALLDKDAEHPLAAGVIQAKRLLQHTTFERLALVESLSKKKDDANYVLEALCRIARAGMTQATVKSDTAKLKRWYRILAATYDAQTALAQNANTKLALTNMMFHI